MSKEYPLSRLIDYYSNEPSGTVSDWSSKALELETRVKELEAIAAAAGDWEAKPYATRTHSRLREAVQAAREHGFIPDPTEAGKTSYSAGVKDESTRLRHALAPVTKAMRVMVEQCDMIDPRAVDGLRRQIEGIMELDPAAVKELQDRIEEMKK